MESVGPGHTQQAPQLNSNQEPGISQSRSRQPYTDFISSHTPQSVLSEPLSPAAVRYPKMTDPSPDSAEASELHVNCNSSSGSNSNASRGLQVAAPVDADCKPISLRRMLQNAAKHVQDRADMKRGSHEKPSDLLRTKFATASGDQSHLIQERSQAILVQPQEQAARQRQQQHRQLNLDQKQLRTPLKGSPPCTRVAKGSADQFRCANGTSLLGYPPRTRASFALESQKQSKSLSFLASDPEQLAPAVSARRNEADHLQGKSVRMPSRPCRTGAAQGRSRGPCAPLKESDEPPLTRKQPLIPAPTTSETPGESGQLATTTTAGEKGVRQAVGSTGVKRMSASCSIECKVSERLQDKMNPPTLLDYAAGAAAADGTVEDRMQPCSIFSKSAIKAELPADGQLEEFVSSGEEMLVKSFEASPRRGPTEKRDFAPCGEAEFSFQMNFQQMYAGGEIRVLPGTSQPLPNIGEGAENITKPSLSFCLPHVQQGFAAGQLNVLADDVCYWSEPIGHCKDNSSVQLFAGIILGPDKEREVVAVKRVPVPMTGRFYDTFAQLEKFTQLSDPLIVNVKRVYCARASGNSCIKEDGENMFLLILLEKCEGRLSDMISLTDLGDRCLQEPLPPPGMTEMLSHLVSGVLKIQQHSRAAHMRVHPGNVLLTEDFELKVGDCAGKIRYTSVIDLLETGFRGALQAQDIIHWILNSPTEASWLSPELLRSFMYMEQQITLMIDQYKSFPPHSRNDVPFAILAQNLRWDTPFLQKADAWSTGATLFYIVSGGHHPFGDPNERSTVRNILEDRKLHLDQIRGSPLIYDLVGSLLEGDPDKRLNLCQALCHPAFWKTGETEHFLKEFKATVEAHAESHLVLALSDPFPWISSLACGASPLFSLLVSYLASPSCPQLLLSSLRAENGLSFLLFLSLLSSDARLPGKDRRALVSSAILLHPAAFLKAVRLLLFPRVPRDPADLVISRSSTYVKHYLGNYSCSGLLHATARQSSSSTNKHFGRVDLLSGGGISNTGSSGLKGSSASGGRSKTGGSSSFGKGGNSADDDAASQPMQLMDACKGAAPRSVSFDQCKTKGFSYTAPQLQRQPPSLPPPPPPVPPRYDSAYGMRMSPAAVAAAAAGRHSNQAAHPPLATPHASFGTAASVPRVIAGVASPASAGPFGISCTSRPPPPPPPSYLAPGPDISAQQAVNLPISFNERILLANAGVDASLLLPSSTTRGQYYPDGNALHAAPIPHRGFMGTETEALCSASTRMVFPPIVPFGVDKRTSQNEGVLRFLLQENNACASATSADACATTTEAAAAEDVRTPTREVCLTVGEDEEAARERTFERALQNVEAGVKHVAHDYGLSCSSGPAVAPGQNTERERTSLHVDPQHTLQQRYVSAEPTTTKPFSIYSFEDKYTDSRAYSAALHISKEYCLEATEDVKISAERKQYPANKTKAGGCHVGSPDTTSVDTSVCHASPQMGTAGQISEGQGLQNYTEEYDADARKDTVDLAVYPKDYTVDVCKERGVDGMAPRAGSTSTGSQSTRLYTSSSPPVFASDRAEEQFHFLKHQDSSSQLVRLQIKREAGMVSAAASNCTLSPSHDSCLSEGCSTTHPCAFPSEAAQLDSAGPLPKDAAEAKKTPKEIESSQPAEQDNANGKEKKDEQRETLEEKLQTEKPDAARQGGVRGRKLKHNASPKEDIKREKHTQELVKKEKAKKMDVGC